MELKAFCSSPCFLTHCCTEWWQTQIFIFILEIYTVAKTNTNLYVFLCRIMSPCIFIWTISMYQDINIRIKIIKTKEIFASQIL